MHIDTRVQQVFRCNTEFAEVGKPFGIDLCKADVLAAIRIDMNRVWIEARFLRGNGVEHLRVYAIALGGTFPTAKCG